jgi:uncharacterized membrane protein
MKNSLNKYRERVKNLILTALLVVLALLVMNPRSDLTFWAHSYIGHNDFAWYLIGAGVLTAIFFVAHIIDKALFFGLDENG